MHLLGYSLGAQVLEPYDLEPPLVGPCIRDRDRLMRGLGGY